MNRRHDEQVKRKKGLRLHTKIGTPKNNPKENSFEKEKRIEI